MEDLFESGHSSCDARAFPLVIIAEAGPMSDEERAQQLDYLDALLETQQPHGLVLDISRAAELSEEHRIFISETLGMRATEIRALWSSVAVVVREDQQELAAFWRSLSPAPSQAFASREEALEWTRGRLPVLATNRPPAGAADNDWFPSREGEADHLQAGAAPEVSTLDAEQEARELELAARELLRARLSNPPPRARRRARPAKPHDARKQAAPVFTSLELPRHTGKIAIILLAVGATAWNLFGPSFGASQFAEQREELALRAYARNERGEELIKKGSKLRPGTPLRFEADLPVQGFALFFAVDPQGAASLTLSKGGESSVGPILPGKAVPLPVSTVVAPGGREAFHLVVCPERIRAKACALDAATRSLTCPESCVVRSLFVDKSAD